MVEIVEENAEFFILFYIKHSLIVKIYKKETLYDGYDEDWTWNLWREKSGDQALLIGDLEDIIE